MIQKPVRPKLINVLLTIFFSAIIIISATGQSVFAQGTGPDGPVNNSTPGTSTSASQGDGLTEVTVPVTLGNTGDGIPQGMDSGAGSLQTQDPLAPDNILATFSYYRLLGFSFNTRTSTTTFGYSFNGCVFETGGSDVRFTAPLLIPSGSVIKYLRLYYNDTNASADITSWITRYQPGVTSEDLTSVTSSGSSGYGTSLSAEITQTVDLTNWAYTVIIWPGVNDSTNAFCGVRVAYYAPRLVTIALPVVKKGVP
jgi:hypothetical protein